MSLDFDTNIDKYSIQFNNNIKVFISLYKFRQELMNSKTTKLLKGVILINKNWFTNYKNFYLFDKVFELITINNLTDLDKTEQQIIFINLFNEFYDKNSSKNLLLFYNREFPEIITRINDNTIKYVNNFEIINEEIYNNLINSLGIFKYFNGNVKYFEFKIQEQNMIIKYANENEKCFNLLLGNFGDKTEIYMPKILIHFPDKISLENEYNSFSKEKLLLYQEGIFDNQLIGTIEYDSLRDNSYDNNVKFLKYVKNEFPHLIEANNNNDDVNLNLNNIIKKEIILKSLIYYYLNNEILIGGDKNVITIEDCKISCCFLINKIWINKFKELYLYQNLILILKEILSNELCKSCIDLNFYKNFLNNDDKISFIIQSITQKTNYMKEIQKIDEKLIIDNLCHINPFFIPFDYSDEILKENYCYSKIYKNFEIILCEKNNFVNALFPILNHGIYKRNNIYINDEKYILFIQEKNTENILDIYYIKEINKDIIVSVECKVEGKKLDDIFYNFKNNTLKQYILSLNFDEKFTAKLNDLGEIIYLIKEGDLFKDLEKKVIVKNILFYFAELIHNIKSKQYIKDSQNHNIDEKYLYLVPKESFIAFLAKYNLDYYDINKNFILKQKYNYSNLNLETTISLLNKYVNDNFKLPSKNVFKSNQEELSKINKNIAYNELPHIIINNHSEKLYYYDDYFFINEKIVNILNVDLNIFPKVEFYIKDREIFIFQSVNDKTIIEIGELDIINIFKLHILIDSTIDPKSIINFLNEYSLAQFYACFFIFRNQNTYSPFFDGNCNIIGNAYKPKEGLNDFSNCYYNQILINIIYLIRYFNIHKYNEVKSSKENYYFLINKTWMNNFKYKYMYHKTKDIIERYPNLSIITHQEYIDKKLLQKMIYFLVNEIQKLNSISNEVSSDKDEYLSGPDLEFIFDHQNRNKFFFYKDFYMLDEVIYSQIFNLKEQQLFEMKLKNNYCKCFFYEGYAFILLINQYDKIIIEVGILDKEKMFNLMYILAFNSENDYQYSLNKMKDKGIHTFFENLKFNENNLVILESIGLKINGGYIYKYSKKLSDICDIYDEFSEDKSNIIMIYSHLFLPIRIFFLSPV